MNVLDLINNGQQMYDVNSNHMIRTESNISTRWINLIFNLGCNIFRMKIIPKWLKLIELTRNKIIQQWMSTENNNLIIWTVWKEWIRKLSNDECLMKIITSLFVLNERNLSINLPTVHFNGKW